MFIAGRKERRSEMKHMSNQQAERLAKGFREFGYDTVTAAEILQLWNDIQTGVANETDPIVVMIMDALKSRIK